jgi:hypothetical protein
VLFHYTNTHTTGTETITFFIFFFTSCLLSYYKTSWDNSATTYFTAISFYEVPTSNAKMQKNVNFKTTFFETFSQEKKLIFRYFSVHIHSPMAQCVFCNYAVDPSTHCNALQKFIIFVCTLCIYILKTTTATAATEWGKSYR